ncbi:hypothetical protein PIB30_074701 [Stylosanthes scabra]|uniref:Uncharacterized protein n=1 Tax=Stylosanthes scabra TaxID=79078 RepID=A0ABU6XMP3_9FABA|nr:hypothetical protein [Stylosanthes scabra]
MGRSPCCDESGLKKGPWTPEEDQKLVYHIQKHGHGSWRALPKLAGLNRCGKSCRLRWTNYLRPDIKRGKFSQEEEQTILHLHSILGNKWSAIASHLPGRTDNEIKNFWNTHLKKKLIQMGFDPMTHQPRTDLVSTLPYLLALASMMDNNNNTSIIDEHALSLQAEAIQMAKLQYLHYLLQSSSSSSSSSSNPNFAFDQNNPINITNMEAPFSLLNVKENHNNNPNPSVIMDDNTNNNGNGIIIDDDSSCQPLHYYHPNVLLSHSLDPPSQQVSFNSQSCLNNINEQGQGTTTNYAIISQMDHTADDNSSWIVPSSSPSSIAPNNNGGSTTTSNNNNNTPGDTSSTTSSYGGEGAPSSSSSYWSELFLVDPAIMHELP